MRREQAAGQIEIDIVRVRAGVPVAARDRLAVEQPLQIRVGERALSTTMRTPGEDLALAVGFLHAEGIIRGAGDVRGLAQVDGDTVRIDVGPGAAAALEASARTFVTSAACGVCGRADLEGLSAGPRASGEDDGPSGRPRVQLAAAVVPLLPQALRAAQATFDRTGGLHAAGLFDVDGNALAVHEDVGRHNAVDKLVGTLLLAGRLPAADRVLVVSGRASFELVQKAEAAGIPILAAVGAPSSLAVERADAAGMTLLGFVRDGGFNVYCGRARVVF